ncbi:hypothetical protein BJY52DRAFT_1379919 [Lactarius psammicola]|nr:hypothetical protein BJY52DRAFT_1379919 [Lactarius psammicola]
MAYYGCHREGRLAQELPSHKRDAKRDDLGRLSTVPTTTTISSEMRGLSPISEPDASNPTRASGYSSISDFPPPPFEPAVDPPSQAPNSPAILHMNRIRSNPARDFVNPSPPSYTDAPLPPPPYPTLDSEIPSSQEDAIVPSSNIPFDTLHKYKLTSRGRDYATVVVVGRAPNVLDPPLLHLGDELNGRIVLHSDNLSDMRSMEVVFQLFESDPIIPSYETKRTLLSQQVHDSCISDGLFTWPFVITPPPVLSSSSSSTTAPGRTDSSPTPLSPRRYFVSPTVRLIVKIYRRGPFTRNLGLSQPIRYVPSPDPVPTPSPSPISPVLPSNLPLCSPCLPPMDLPWPRQKLPAVIVRGVIFGQLQVEVECKLIIPVSYPVSDVIPLHLVMTSESREALDLFVVSHVIDVRLLKVLNFGKNAANLDPFNIRNHSSYRRTDWAARAQWETNAPWEPPSDEHPHWRIKLNGKLHWDQNVSMIESFENPGMALMYYVCLFPFRSTFFRPATDPDKEIFMAKLPITRRG